jgi:hypothetical protein
MRRQAIARRLRAAASKKLVAFKVAPFVLPHDSIPDPRTAVVACKSLIDYYQAARHLFSF